MARSVTHISIGGTLESGLWVYLIEKLRLPRKIDTRCKKERWRALRECPPSFLSFRIGLNPRLHCSCDYRAAKSGVVVEHVVHTALVVDLKLGSLDSELLR